MTAKYLSNRKFPLIFQGELGSDPIITMENYCKWYDIYVVFPDGSVKTIDLNKLDIETLGMEKDGASSILDHAFHPMLIQRVAQELCYVIDPVSFETIIGRWELEYHNKYPELE